MRISSIFTKFGRFIKKFQIELTLKSVIINNKAIIDFSTKIITNNNKLYIGKKVYLRSKKRGYHAALQFPTTILMDVPGSEVAIGDYSRINGAYIHAQKKIEIGKNCVIASGVQIMDTNGHELISSNRTVGRDKPKEIKIGNNVWIGINAIILKGSDIGNNSVVAAGSVVKGIFPENSLIIGNPAKKVKTLPIDK